MMWDAGAGCANGEAAVDAGDPNAGAAGADDPSAGDAADAGSSAGARDAEAASRHGPGPDNFGRPSRWDRPGPDRPDTSWSDNSRHPRPGYAAARRRRGTAYPDPNAC